jgi:hypothetical protein
MHRIIFYHTLAKRKFQQQEKLMRPDEYMLYTNENAPEGSRGTLDEQYESNRWGSPAGTAA